MEFQTSTKEKSTDFERPHIQEGIYDAVFKEVKEISEGKFGERVVFIFAVEDKELGLVCYSKNPATKDNKLGQTLEAIGVPLNDEVVNTIAYQGSKVKAWVEDFSYEEDGKQKVASAISKVKKSEEEAKVVSTQTV